MKKSKILILILCSSFLILNINNKFDFNYNYKNSLEQQQPNINICASNMLNLTIIDYKNENGVLYVELGWQNGHNCIYYALYRYNGDPSNSTVKNITLFANLNLLNFTDIPNIEHPYYMVRGYYANGSYVDSLFFNLGSNLKR
ncbi:MAG: hypothetical protein ACTSO2_16805 [Promethearchaeota archaeon]